MHIFLLITLIIIIHDNNCCDANNNINRHDDIDDGLLVSTSILNKPLSSLMSSSQSLFNTDDDSYLANLFKKHKHSIMNRNHALISISHPRYSFYLQQPSLPMNSYVHQQQQQLQNELLLNSLINNQQSFMPDYINLMPYSTTTLPFQWQSSIRNLIQQQKHHDSIQDLIHKNVDNNYNDDFIQNDDSNFNRQNHQNKYHKHHLNMNKQSYHHLNDPSNINQNKHKIQIGQKFSQSIYANNNNLRYENGPKSINNNKHRSTINNKIAGKNLSESLSKITNNAYYGINDEPIDGEDNNNNNNGKKSINQSNVFIGQLSNKDYEGDSKEKGFF